MWKAVIVEDELASSQRLERLLGHHRDRVQVVATADSGPGGVEAVARTSADLVFLDVSLPGFDGFDVVHELSQPIKIVITTASEEHALRALRTRVDDYLLKPVDPLELGKTIDRLCTRVTEPEDATDRENAPLYRVLCRERNTTHVIDPRDVLYFKSDRGATLVKTAGHDYLATESLAIIEEGIGPEFVRIHRNAVVNTAHVSCLRHDGPDVLVVLRGGETLEVSRRHVQRLKHHLRFGPAAHPG